jgi:hypothetical protein
VKARLFAVGGAIAAPEAEPVTLSILPGGGAGQSPEESWRALGATSSSGGTCGAQTPATALLPYRAGRLEISHGDSRHDSRADPQALAFYEEQLLAVFGLIVMLISWVTIRYMIGQEELRVVDAMSTKGA